MCIAAVICECNPFHWGHKYLIHMTKKNKCSGIVAVMSGNYVQRGDIAIISKWDRARSALYSGVDLVLELPTLFSMSRAEMFASGAVQILDALNVVEVLSFGSDGGNLIDLQKSASFFLTEKFSDDVKKYLKQGVSFAKARQRTLCDFFADPNIRDTVVSSNDILNIEYIKSIISLGSSIRPFAVKRIGVDHDSNFTLGNLASASFIRREIINCGLNKNVLNFMPETTFNILKDEFAKKKGPANILYGERAILSKLKSMNCTEISNVLDVNEGLENRIYRAISKSCSLEDFYRCVRTKRYTNARLRRIVLSAFLGITKQYEHTKPKYIRVLGFNKKGVEILKLAKERAKLPIVTRFSDVKKLDDDARKMFDLQSKFDNLYSIFLPTVKPNEFKSAIYVDKKVKSF